MGRLVLAAALLVLVAAEAGARPWAWLGIRIRDLSEQEMEEIAGRHGIREGFGVVVVEVMASTPAERAGLRNGDLIVGFQDRPITDTRTLQRVVGAGPLDGDSRLIVLRSEGRRELTVRLVAMPPEIAGDRVAAEFGFAFRDVEVRGEPGPAPPGPPAPTVGIVVRGGPAERAGLEVGDVVVEVDGRPVASRQAARELLGQASAERALRLTVRRGERRVPLTLAAP